MAGGETRFNPKDTGGTPEQNSIARTQNEAAEASCRRSGQVKMNEAGFWCREAFSLYFDRKDWQRDGAEYRAPAMQSALRAIREGSGGLLGNPPLL